MSAARWRSSHARLMDHFGEPATNAVVRRYSGTGPARTSVEVAVRAKFEKADPQQLGNGVVEGGGTVIILAEDLEGSAITLPLLAGDKIKLGSKVLNIDSVDMRTRRVAGGQVGIECKVSG